MIIKFYWYLNYERFDVFYIIDSSIDLVFGEY